MHATFSGTKEGERERVSEKEIKSRWFLCKTRNFVYILVNKTFGYNEKFFLRFLDATKKIKENTDKFILI